MNIGLFTLVGDKQGTCVFMLIVWIRAKIF